MITLQAWLEQHPEASAVPARPGQVGGGQWLYPNGEDTRELFKLTDYKVSSNSSGVIFLTPKRSGKYGGAIPVAELDLPRREESVQREVDALLEAPGGRAEFEPGAKKRLAWEKSARARGARPFGDPALFSKTMPDLTDEEWERLKASNRARGDRWELEKAKMRGESSPAGIVSSLIAEAPEKYVIWLKEKGEWVEQGDGPLTLKTAERIVRELRQDFGGAYKILPVGDEP